MTSRNEFLSSERKGVADYINFIGDFYWLQKTKELRLQSGLGIYDFFRNFALIQFCGYTSKKFKPFKKGYTLESQKFVVKLIRHIAENRPEVKFIMSRGVRLWTELLGVDFINGLKAQYRLFFTHSCANQALTANNLGAEAFGELVSAIKK